MAIGSAKFYVGLARRGREIVFRGYRRQPLCLQYRDDCGDFANAVRIDFGTAAESWGVIDGLSLSKGIDGPVVAVSPLVLPMIVRAGFPVYFDPGRVVMNAKSIEAIVNQRPIRIRPVPARIK